MVTLDVMPPLIAGAQIIRAGIIGCDTSHVPAFSKVFNNSEAGTLVSCIKVVVAFLVVATISRLAEIG